eukprot:2360866-Pleurochrysis_carterae.AAC.3
MAILWQKFKLKSKALTKKIKRRLSLNRVGSLAAYLSSELTIRSIRLALASLYASSTSEPVRASQASQSQLEPVRANKSQSEQIGANQSKQEN